MMFKIQTFCATNTFAITHGHVNHIIIHIIPYVNTFNRLNFPHQNPTEKCPKKNCGPTASMPQDRMLPICSPAMLIIANAQQMQPLRPGKFSTVMGWAGFRMLDGVIYL